MHIPVESLRHTRFIDNGGLELAPITGQSREVIEFVNERNGPQIVNLNTYLQDQNVFRFAIKVPGSTRLLDGLSQWNLIPDYLVAERSIELFEPCYRGQGYGKRAGWLMNFMLQMAGYVTALAVTDIGNSASNAHLLKHFGELVNTDETTNYYECSLNRFQYPVEFSPVTMVEV